MGLRMAELSPAAEDDSAPRAVAARVRARTWAVDLVLVAAAAAVAVVTALTFGGAADASQRAGVGIVGVALIILPVAMLRRPELALYGLVPLMTAVSVAPAPVDFMAVGLFGALVIRGDIRRAARPPRAVSIGLMLLVAAYAAAIVVAPSDGAFSYAAATLLAVTLGCVTYVLASRDPRTAERAFVVAGLVLAVETIAALSPLGAAMRDGIRVRGLFADPNEFGAFAVPAITLLCVRWPTLSRPRRYGALGLLVVPIVASLSRGAVLAVGVALAVLVAVALRRHLPRVLRRSSGILGLGAAAVLAVVFFAGSALPERNVSSLIQPFDTERFGGQLAGVEEVLRQPLSLGIGPGSYEAVLGHESRETYLRALVETGALSLAALLVVFWAVLRLIWRPDLDTLAWVAAFAGFAACGLFVDTLHWRELWAVMGVAFAVAAHRRHSAARP
jgi:hypothetical protein